MDIIVCGIHLRDCERLFFEKFYRSLSTIQGSEYFVVTTCNRIEIYFLSKKKTAVFSDIREYIEKLYIYESESAFYHLCYVLSGLDSIFIGESNIKYQIKKAYELQKRGLGSLLHFFIQKAFKVSKEIRNRFVDERKVNTLESYVIEKMGQMERRESVLFVGYSSINRAIANRVISSNLFRQVVFNTDYENIKYKRLERKQLHNWVDYDCVVVATKSNKKLLHVADLKDQERECVLFDLSVPRNIEAEISKYCRVIDMVGINRNQEDKNEAYREAKMYAMRRALFFRDLARRRESASKSVGCQEFLERALCP